MSEERGFLGMCRLNRDEEADLEIEVRKLFDPSEDIELLDVVGNEDGTVNAAAPTDSTLTMRYDEFCNLIQDTIKYEEL